VGKEKSRRASALEIDGGMVRERARKRESKHETESESKIKKTKARER